MKRWIIKDVDGKQVGVANTYGDSRPHEEQATEAIRDYCDRKGMHLGNPGLSAEECNDAMALMPAGPMSPEQASEFARVNEGYYPPKFTLRVSYGALFFGMGRGKVESQMMDAIMKIISYNYAVNISKEDENGCVVLECERYARGGERIASSHTAMIDRI